MRHAIAIALLFTLTACSTWNSWMGNDPADPAAPKAKKDEPAACVPVFVPSTVASSVIGGSDSPMDAKANIRISTGEVNCDPAIKDGKLEQTVEVKITATKGPALKGNKVNASFFAAVVSANGDVIAKKQYQTVFTFGEEMKVDEEQELEFKINKADASRTNIYIGLSDAVATIK